MMPIIDSSPAHHHHHHGHGHQNYYHQQAMAELTGKMQLTLILPNGVPSTMAVDADTPMMDLLVQAASSNKLNPSNYSLVILDSNQHVIHFKPNQTVGQLVGNCHLPQLNGSSTISLLPKEISPSTPSSKSKNQPFEITVRLQVNLPDGQKILLRVDPTLPLFEIKEQICKQKKYSDSSRYTLRLPNKLDHPLLLGLSLAEYKSKELTMIHLKQDQQLGVNQIQSFDRLYRARSESQHRQQSPENLPEDNQESNEVKERAVSVQSNKTRSMNQTVSVTSLPERASHPPIVSYTSLHAYWNDPNFDTQSQSSNISSSTKKRRAPLAPTRISPNVVDSARSTPGQINVDHHQSIESLPESQSTTKQKRKAPVPPSVNVNNSTEILRTESPNKIDQENLKTSENEEKLRILIDPEDEKRLVALISEQKSPTQARLIIQTNETEQENCPSTLSTPIYSQVEKKNETKQVDSSFSNVEISTSSPKPSSTKNYSLDEIVQAGIAQPPTNEPEKVETNEGLTKIINDHRERSPTKQQIEEKPTENVSYFRVAKSRYGKFETDNRGFAASSIPIFDENQSKNEKSENPNPTKTTTTTKITEILARPAQTKSVSNGKKAYNLLKKYEKEDDDESMKTPLTVDTEYLKTESNNEKTTNQKLPTPIQLEVTERTTHISVTVESDRKQMITRVSPQIETNNETNGSPSGPILAPKPFGKTITEYRTVRRIGADGETNTTTTVRTETIPRSDENDQKQENVETPTNLTEN